MKVVIPCCLLLLLALAARTQTPQMYYKSGGDKFLAKDYPGAMADFSRP